MNRRRAPLLTAALTTVALAGLGAFSACTGPAPESALEPGGEETGSAAGPQATLYFPAASGMLEVEMRPTPSDLPSPDKKLWLAEQLVAGPTSEGLRSALPAETRVASVFAAPDGTVFVDFIIPETVGMGSTQELLTVFSVVNTLLLDDDAAQRVVLLINGRQRETLAGHLDTSIPLAERPDLVREAG
jgi:hypothetical protein